MEYSDFPMPKSYPDFPHHDQIAAYFDDYVDHFGFRDRIRFETEGRARRARGRRRAGSIRATDGTTERYDALLVANGHHWDPRWPEPAFPGSDDFAGRADARARLHGHRTVCATRASSCSGWATARWTSRSSPRYVARTTYLAARRGAWIIPKYLFGRPLDQLEAATRGSRSRSASR